MRLRARMESSGGTKTGIAVPEEFVAGLGSGRHPRVRVTLGSYAFRSSIASMGGRFMLPVTAETRSRAGVGAGEEVELDIVVDPEPREVAVPAGLAAALEADAEAGRAFESLSHSGRWRLVMPIECAESEETRRRGIENALTGLRDGPA